MTKLFPAAALILTASAVAAEETRQLDAHEHGVGQLDIAFDGDKIAMRLHAPGADIVGFEYEAKSAEDRAKVDEAVATLARPLGLFILPTDAECSVVQASASLEAEEAHDDHGHEDHAAHGEESHNHEEHSEHKDDHDAASHTEFHAEYLLVCAEPKAAENITFAYFESFPNALELEVQVISDRGAMAFEVEKDAPTLDLRNMF